MLNYIFINLMTAQDGTRIMRQTMLFDRLCDVFFNIIKIRFNCPTFYIGNRSYKGLNIPISIEALQKLS